ncbi:MAG: hypothetical protein M1837_002745 [Sclerophora amabilis]|nr:MAG: hypothetical protein M1837_002745 [Sclerophora amabilis]
MSTSLPSTSSLAAPLRRAALSSSSSSSSSPPYFATSIRTTLTIRRHASLLRRPLRPYTFTQLLTLSDGSTVIQRTTSPFPIYKSAKDVRNHPLWNPSSHKLANIEEDEAGRLRAFRERFGRGWDAEAAASGREDEGDDELDEDGRGDLMDLISGGYEGNLEADDAAGKGKKGKS